MLEKKPTNVSGYETGSGKAVPPYVASRNTGTSKPAIDTNDTRKKSADAAAHITQINETADRSETGATDAPLTPSADIAWRQRRVSAILRRFLNSSPKVQKIMAPGLAAEVTKMSQQKQGKEKSLILKFAKKLPKNKMLVPQTWDEVRETMVKELTEKGRIHEAQAIKTGSDHDVYKKYMDPQIHNVVRQTLMLLDERDAKELREALDKVELSVIERN